MASNCQKRLLGFYERMLLVRECELKLSALFSNGAVPVLNDSDTIASNHRGHGLAIAKGVDLGMPRSY